MKKKSILLIGIGRFGKHIAVKLNELGHEIMAVDVNEERINDIIPYVTNAQIGNSTNESFLKSLGINDYDVCIVTIGDDFQSSLETTCLLKELGAKKVVSRAERDGQAKFLLRNGADEIVYPEKQLASWMAIKYGSDHILDYIEIDDSCSIYEVDIPKEWLGKTIGQIDIRKKFNINIIAVKQDGKANAFVTPDTTLTDHQTLLVLGENKMLKKCFGI
ncbi:MAG: TrkA family potassium uptake protein [Clostridia bacterium]|nr:TrkA family potassium uptake protein [Clostridia bacterium]